MRPTLLLVLLLGGDVARAGSVPVSSVGVCPDDMVATGMGSCIDQYPWPNVAGEHPLLGVSGIPNPVDQKAGRVMDARALCAGVGKRVCNIDEWEVACKGPGGTRYPWGDKRPKFTPGKDAGTLPCNADKKYRGPDEAKIARRDAAEFARLDQSEPMGSRPCESGSGARDMIGAVEQWVKCPGRSPYGWCLVGRFWADLRTCSFAVTTHSPRFFYYETGARCCLDLTE